MVQEAHNGHVVAVYFSSSSEFGNTAKLLSAFMKGVERRGDETKIFDVNKIQPSPCTGELHCWSKDQGNCSIQDDMQDLYPVLWQANTLVLGPPMYIPLPYEMQNLLNRLTPILDPQLETRGGRTRGRLRQGVSISRIVLVATSGWCGKSRTWIPQSALRGNSQRTYQFPSQELFSGHTLQLMLSAPKRKARRFSRPQSKLASSLRVVLPGR